MGGRLELSRCLQIGCGLRSIPLTGKKDAKVEIRLKYIRLCRDRLAIGVDSFGCLFLSIVDIAQIEPGAIIVGIGGNGFFSGEPERL